MFDIRIEDDGVVRWYKTDDYNSAVVLFDVLCRSRGTTIPAGPATR